MSSTETTKVASAEGGAPSAPEILAHLDHLLHSDRFRKTPSLCQLLSYLVKQTVSGQTGHIKETVIGIEVFGRRDDFDGRIDNIVRVHAHRLRKLMDAYYAEEGQGQAFRIVIPKGHYVPQFVGYERAAPVAEVEAVEIVEAPVQAAAGPSAFRRYWVAAACVALFAVGVAAGSFFPRLFARPAALTPELASLWRGFLLTGDNPIVAYSNPVFLRGPSSRVMIPYNGPLSAAPGALVSIQGSQGAAALAGLEHEGPLRFSDSWTGTGEVMAVHKLTQLATAGRATLRVRRSRALTIDEMKSGDVLFVGAPSGNTMLDKIHLRPTPFSSASGRIINHSPRSGEAKEFRASDNEVTGELYVTHSLFSVMPGLTDAHRIIVSAGLSTHATWAAIDFFTSPEGAKSLYAQLGLKAGAALPEYFQAVTRTQIVNGEASQTSLVTARAIEYGQPKP